MQKTVAVVGASNDRRKYGNKALRAFRKQGYTVIPINVHASQIEGLTAYRSVLDAPGPIDMATFYVPPAVGESLLDEMAAKGIPEVWVNPGAESEALASRARELKVQLIMACSIMGIGETPGDF